MLHSHSLATLSVRLTDDSRCPLNRGAIELPLHGEIHLVAFPSCHDCLEIDWGKALLARRDWPDADRTNERGQLPWLANQKPRAGEEETDYRSSHPRYLCDPI